MITSNMWQAKGIVNGAMGVLRHVVYEKGVKPPQLPLALIIEMDSKYTGPHLDGKPR
jgi:hypothetical protein